MAEYDFDEWPKEKVVNYLEFLIHNYRVMDAFWFLNLEKELGHEEACRYNELVWGKTAQLAARDIKKRFSLDQGGLEDFVRGQQLFPWSMLVGYHYDVQPDEVVISVPSCPPQEARLERGLGEYDCQAMHMAEFSGFAQEIDPRIRVECLFAPPDDHPPDMFCKWRFSLTAD